MLKIQNIFDICPAEFVNRLVIISYHAEISIFLCQNPNQLKLHRIRILILIYHNIAEPLLIIIKYLRLCLKQLYCLHEKIIKIQCIVCPQSFFIFFIYLCDLLLSEIPRRIQFIFFRRDQLILRRRNRRQKVPLLIDFCINL